MAYPKRTIVKSSLLRGQSNGQLPTSILVATPGQSGGPTVRLIAPAARGWKALCGEAAKAGHILKATSLYDSYRPYDIQERTFLARYTTQYLPGRPYKTWNGKRYYQRPNTAVAAVPGTSNHGWAAAVDAGEERDSDADAESLDNPTLNWLLSNEQRFGFFHSVDSEPWHIDWYPGDIIPQAVLDYENGTPNGDDEMEVWLRGEKGEITLMAGTTVRSIKDMAGFVKNLTARGIKGTPPFSPVLQADVLNGVYGAPVGMATNSTVNIDDATLEKMAAFIADKTAEEIHAMLDAEINAHFATAGK